MRITLKCFYFFSLKRNGVILRCYICSSCSHVGNMKRYLGESFLESEFACEKTTMYNRKSIVFPLYGMHKHDQTIIFIKGRKV